MAIKSFQRKDERAKSFTAEVAEDAEKILNYQILRVSLDLSPCHPVSVSPCRFFSPRVGSSLPVSPRPRVRRYSSQSAMKMSVWRGLSGFRFDAQTSFFPSDENKGKESKVLLKVMRVRFVPSRLMR